MSTSVVFKKGGWEGRRVGKEEEEKDKMIMWVRIDSVSSIYWACTMFQALWPVVCRDCIV